MANGFDTAQADIEQQRRDANAAIAAAGSAGAAAFAQGQQQVEAARSAAVNQALSEAAQRGQGNIAGVLGGTIGRPYAQLGAGLASSAASHAADNAMMGGSADRYFREVGAAVPVSAANLEAAIARQKAKDAAKNQLSDSELRTRLMGAGELQRDEDISGAQHTHHIFQQRVEKAKKGLEFIDGALRQPHADKKALHGMQAQLMAELETARTARAPITESLRQQERHPVEEYARRAGVDNGFDENRVFGLIKQPKAVQGKPLTAQEAAQSIGLHGRHFRRVISGHLDANDSPWFQTAAAALDKGLKAGDSWKTAWSHVDLYVPKHLKKVRSLIKAMYEPAFEGS